MENELNLRHYNNAKITYKSTSILEFNFLEAFNIYIKHKNVIYCNYAELFLSDFWKFYTKTSFFKFLFTVISYYYQFLLFGIFLFADPSNFRQFYSPKKIYLRSAFPLHIFDRNYIIFFCTDGSTLNDTDTSMQYLLNLLI